MPVSLTFAELRDGYVKSTENALDLLSASGGLFSQHAAVALGVAELGQEELGKSLTLLAAFSLPSDPSSWNWLWHSWKNHQLKAHRAFLYELIHPTRLETVLPDGSTLDGRSLRSRFSDEKESSVYVNVDPSTRSFVKPADSVSGHEIQNRIATLTYLTITAYQVRHALELADDVEFAHRTFGALAHRICSEQIFSEDMPGIFDALAAQSAAHRALVASVQTALSAGADFLKHSVPLPPCNREPG